MILTSTRLFLSCWSVSLRISVMASSSNALAMSSWLLSIEMRDWVYDRRWTQYALLLASARLDSGGSRNECAMVVGSSEPGPRKRSVCTGRGADMARAME